MAKLKFIVTLTYHNCSPFAFSVEPAEKSFCVVNALPMQGVRELDIHESLWAWMHVVIQSW